MSERIAIFLKAPRLGCVKTRLATQVGPETALRLYDRMARHALACARETSASITIWFMPPDAEDEFRAWLGEAHELRPQSDGDLGQRLAAAARVESGARWICIGGDCPGLTAELLIEAFAALRRWDVVLGPTADGGYYLVGGRTPLPDIFSGMPWSSGDLLEETRRRLKHLQASWSELPTLRDVDTAADAATLGLLTSLNSTGHIGSPNPIT